MYSLQNNNEMLPTHASAGELLNSVGSTDQPSSNNISSAVNRICDTDHGQPVHGNNAMSNLLQRLDDNDDDADAGSSSSVMWTKSRADGIAARRPDALALKPINTCRPTDRSSADEHDASNLRSRDPNQKFINIGFNNISYSVKSGLWRRENKYVLNGVSGEFRAGELSAIMGPSGAGKSTLLDILSGYITETMNGLVTVNGRSRDLRLFRRQVAYIMQEGVLQQHITVWEAMFFSASLKIGGQMTKAEKKRRIMEIIKAIGLYDCRKTMTGSLSGGQKKRLAIALELVDNPPVMFFDEPTSGLDSSTSTQVILLLKQLSEEGRTIVCTIHQPSALVFGLFDHLYAIAEGQCIYTGGTQLVVPFLAELNLVCPETYNPSDYLLEIATHDYGNHNSRLVEKIHNGLGNNYRKCKASTAQIYALGAAEKMMQNGLVTPVKAPNLAVMPIPPLSPLTEQAMLKMKPKIRTIKIDTTKLCVDDGTYAASFCRQLVILIARSFLLLWRDPSLTMSRVAIHLIISLLIGTLYFGIGNDAHMVFNNFRYIFLSIMFLMYTAYSSLTIRFPLELPIITREHFNRWYSVKAYYFASTLADLPIQTVCVLIFVLVTYFMTGQPLEFYRIAIFFGIMMMVTLVGQALGTLVGSIFNVTNGAIFGSFFIAPFLIFSGFFIRMVDAAPILHWLFHISFLKYALEGTSLAIFGFDRPKMECNELFCMYRIPKKFLKMVNMHNGDFLTAGLVLLGMIVLLRILSFVMINIRLKRRW